jgi:Skp family chaperone for outer membrane proteins
MKTFRFIIVSFIFSVVFAVSVFAQAQPPAKIALVDTESFYDQKTGITKILNAYKSLETEFKTTTTDLESGAKRLQVLQTELQNINAKVNDPNNKVPIDEKAAQAKTEEAQKLQRDLKFKDEEFKAQLQKREAAILGPIIQDIGKALGDFAKQKGYTVVLDVGKLYQAQIILYWQESTEITDEFVKFYNARPAGTATTK